MRVNNVRTKYGQPVQAEIDKMPDTCPACHKAINPIDLSLSYMASGVVGSQQRDAVQNRAARIA